MASIFALVLSFFFILSQNTSHSNPLDSLSPSEINNVASIVKDSKLGMSHNFSFHYVGLHEPKKGSVLSWLKNSTKKPPPRRAFVIARAEEHTYEIIVGLTTHSIVSYRIYNGSGYPMFSVYDEDTATSLSLTYTPFIESIKKRGIDIKHVVLKIHSNGLFGRSHERVYRVTTFAYDMSPNTWVRRIEGITFYVDLDKMEIVDYLDSHIVSFAQAKGTEYQTSEVKPSVAADNRPMTVFQPNRPSFKIDGEEIRFVVCVV